MVVVLQKSLRSWAVSFIFVAHDTSIKVSRLIFLSFARRFISVCVLNRTTTIVSASNNLLAEDGLIPEVLKGNGEDPYCSYLSEQNFCRYLVPEGDWKESKRFFWTVSDEEVEEVCAHS